MKHSDFKFQISNFQTGQTLIETLAALFILVMGVSASVGLAVYSFGSSNNIIKQIVATGLAREGLEAVRNMRDTNWLKDTLATNSCYDYATASSTAASCYPDWLSQVFCINPSASSCGNAPTGTPVNYFLGFDSDAVSQPNFWFLATTTTAYGLNFDANNSGTTGFYSPGAGVSCDNTAGRSDYCRKIVLTKSTSTPYNQNVGPLLKVQSQVWWVGKNCSRVADFTSAPTRCKLELVTYLTNWKNY